DAQENLFTVQRITLLANPLQFHMESRQVGDGIRGELRHARRAENMFDLFFIPAGQEHLAGCAAVEGALPAYLPDHPQRGCPTLFGQLYDHCVRWAEDVDAADTIEGFADLAEPRRGGGVDLHLAQVGQAEVQQLQADLVAV